jgi:hypothetical protein
MALAFALLASPALAGKITITVRTSPTDVFKGDIQISDANVARILSAWRKLYFPIGILVTPATPGDPNAEPPVPPTAAVYRAATDQEVVLRAADVNVADWRAYARRIELDAARTQADTTVNELPADPAIP